MPRVLRTLCLGLSLCGFVGGAYLLSQTFPGDVEERVLSAVDAIEAAPDLPAQSDAAHSLGSLADVADQAVPLIMARCRRSSPSVRVVCYREVFALGRATSAYIGLLDVILNTDPGTPLEVKTYAARLLGDLGEGDKEHLPDRLNQAIAETLSTEVKIWLYRALWRAARDTRAPEQVKGYLGSEQDDIRNLAAQTLADMGDFSHIRARIKMLAGEPSDRGRFAALSLQRERLELAAMRQVRVGLADEAPDTAVLETILKEIAEKYVDVEKTAREPLLQAGARNLARDLDPYCAYFTPDTERLQKDIQARQGGIGVTLGVKWGALCLQQVQPGGPAAQAGLRPMDFVRKLADKDERATAELTPLEATALIAGEPGAELALTIFRSGWMQPRELTLSRVVRQAPKPRAATLAGGLLLVQPGALDEAALGFLRAELDKKPRGVALDLRHVIGGAVEDAVAFADLFLAEGKVVAQRVGRDEDLAPREKFSTTQAAAYTAPLVLLLDIDTEGAAELLAGALADHERALAVGVASYGSGVMVQDFPLAASKGQTTLRLTVARYQTPLGKKIHESGVIPAVHQAPRLESDGIGAALDVLRAQNLAHEYFAALSDADQGAVRALLQSSGSESFDLARYPGAREFLIRHEVLPPEVWLDSDHERQRNANARDRASAARALRRLLRRELLPEAWYDPQDDLVLARALCELALSTKLDEAPEYRALRAPLAEYAAILEERRKNFIYRVAPDFIPSARSN